MLCWDGPPELVALRPGSAQWTIGMAISHNFWPARCKVAKLVLCDNTTAVSAKISHMIVRDTGAGPKHQQRPSPGH